MLRHRLPRHVHTDAQFRQRLTVVRVEAIEQHPSAAISESFEDTVGIALQAHDDMQVNTCMSITLSYQRCSTSSVLPLCLRGLKCGPRIE